MEAISIPLKMGNKPQRDNQALKYQQIQIKIQKEIQLFKAKQLKKVQNSSMNKRKISTEKILSEYDLNINRLIFI